MDFMVLWIHFASPPEPAEVGLLPFSAPAVSLFLIYFHAACECQMYYFFPLLPPYTPTSHGV